MTNMPDRLLPTGDAARALGVSGRTLVRWAREGLVKPALVTAGGHLRWDLNDLRNQLRAIRQVSQD